MSLQVENLEKNMAKLTVEVPAEKFIEAIGQAYKESTSERIQQTEEEYQRSGIP